MSIRFKARGDNSFLYFKVNIKYSFPNRILWRFSHKSPQHKRFRLYQYQLKHYSKKYILSVIHVAVCKEGTNNWSSFPRTDLNTSETIFCQQWVSQYWTCTARNRELLCIASVELMTKPSIITIHTWNIARKCSRCYTKRTNLY